MTNISTAAPAAPSDEKKSTLPQNASRVASGAGDASPDVQLEQKDLNHILRTDSSRGYEDLAFDPRPYGVSLERGFLPLQDPIESLPQEFAVWQETLMAVSGILEVQKTLSPELGEKIRSIINEKIPLLDSARLATLPEQRLGAAVIAQLSMVYVWSGGENAAPSLLPKHLSVPLRNLTEALQLPPIVTHAVESLYNYKIIDLQKPPTAENLRAIHVMAGGKNESSFLMIPTEVEFSGIPAVKAFLKAQKAVAGGHGEVILQCLEDVVVCLSNVTKAMKKMPTCCSPDVFYDKIRPFFAGWNQCKSLPDGLYYENEDPTLPVVPFKLDGGSGGQSSMVHLFDSGLGITHGTKDLSKMMISTQKTSGEIHDSTQPERADTSGMQKLRAHMPRNHQRFLQAVESGPSIRQFILSERENHSSEGNDGPAETEEHRALLEKLIDAYNRCVEGMLAFRSQHINIAALFIVNQARKRRKQEKEASATSATMTTTADQDPGNKNGSFGPSRLVSRLASMFTSSSSTAGETETKESQALGSSSASTHNAAPLTLDEVGTSGTNFVTFLAGVKSDTKDALIYTQV